MGVGMILPTRDPGGGSLTVDSFVAGAQRIEEFDFDGVWCFDAISRGDSCFRSRSSR